MKLTTTQHLGHRLGRARLGACGHLPVHGRSHRGGANLEAGWRNPAAAALCPMNATTGAYVVTTTFDQGSIKRTARHLRTRST